MNAGTSNTLSLGDYNVTLDATLDAGIDNSTNGALPPPLPLDTLPPPSVGTIPIPDITNENLTLDNLFGALNNVVSGIQGLSANINGSNVPPIGQVTLPLASQSKTITNGQFLLVILLVAVIMWGVK